MCAQIGFFLAYTGITFGDARSLLFGSFQNDGQTDSANSLVEVGHPLLIPCLCPPNH